MLVRAHCRAAALFALVILAACGTDSTTSTIPPGAINLAVSDFPSSLAVDSTRRFTISVTRGQGYSGDVDLSIDSLPPGVFGFPFPNRLTNGVAVSSVSLSASRATTSGTYPITIRGTGTGVAAGTLRMNLVVTSPPGYQLDLTSPSLSVFPGTSASTRVLLKRTGGFTGAVNLLTTVSDSRVPLTIFLSPFARDSAVLTVTAAPTANAATLTLILTGRAAGLEDRTVAAVVSVRAGVSALEADPHVLRHVENSERDALR
ncbi:MAG: hypothetical protein ABIP93_00760 [Gemmatimonadaceae bacterium]